MWTRNEYGGYSMRQFFRCANEESEPPAPRATFKSLTAAALLAIDVFRWGPFAAAMLLALQVPMSASAQESEDEQRGRTIEEIIVTATKREANMQDVAQSIEVFTTDKLERLGARDMKEYIDALPSVTLVNSVPGRNTVVFRGVSTGASEYRTDSTVAVYLDEQPLTTNSQQVDPWLVDIERIEALPGPQGTLFGSSSQSGTLRIIANKPNHDGISGQFDVSASGSAEGDPSYDVSGWLNLPPIGQSLAVRAAAFFSHEGGYIDNILGPDLAGTTDNSNVAEDDFNVYEVAGGRVSALWDVNDRWSILFAGILQNSTTEGAWDSDPELGDFKITKFFDEYREDDWYQVAMTITGDLGFAELSATTASFDREIVYEWDNMVYEQYKDAYWGVYNGYGLYNSEYTFGTNFNDQIQERFSQEVRLTSTGEGRLQWMVGAFYEDVYDEWLYGAQNPELMNTLAWETANSYAYNYYASYDHIEYPLAPTDIGFYNQFERAVEQQAVFGEVSYDLTDKWLVQVGARWFEYDRSEYDQFHFPRGLPPLSAIDSDGAYTAGGNENDVAMKFSTTYQIDNDRMVYALYSEGFRLGGSNSQRAANTGLVPLNYGADKLGNYEVGLKSEWLDNRLQVNVSLFLMEWTDIQMDNAGGVDDKWWLRGTINGDTAQTKGVEVNWVAQITDNLLLEGSLFSANPEFTSEYELIGGDVVLEGTVMPISPDFKYWLALEYTMWDFMNIGDLWFRYDTSYQSEVYNDLTAAIIDDPDGVQPSWTMANFSAGLAMFNGTDLTFSVYNLWDERSMNWLGNDDAADQFNDPRYQHIRSYVAPRSIGLSVTRRF